jgi:GNAT superfamily N-acetyltransferase
MESQTMQELRSYPNYHDEQVAGWRHHGTPLARLAVCAWWRDDHIPTLAPLPGIRIARSDDARLIARLAGITKDEAADRLRDRHQLYLGWLHDQPVAYGWSATRRASIDEIGRSFRIPSGDRYLWDFATLPAWRGYGIYPRLLQAIIRVEHNDAEHFWIAFLPVNHASERGIAKAGFRPAGAVVAAGRALRLAACGPVARARSGAALLGVPLSHGAASTQRDP